MTQAQSWLLLVHHLPPRPTRLRVRVWRQLQKLGAVAVKNSVYVLPWSERTLEDFTWLQQEIASGGGEAVVFRATTVAGATDDDLVAAFRRDRDVVYARLASEVDRLGKRIEGRSRARSAAPAELGAFDAEVDAMQAELTSIEEVDFFEAEGRGKAAAALERCRGLLRSAAGRKSGTAARAARGSARSDPSRFQGKLWVTRPRPHIDRCASAWLIRRFIDRRPRFAFAEPDAAPRGGIPYDMPGATFGHQGEDCTFETLVKHFGLGGDAALAAIAQIVHDVDLKDAKFGRPEAAGVNAVLRGLSESAGDDHRLLREAGSVFDGLYETLSAPGAKGIKRASRRRR